MDSLFSFISPPLFRRYGVLTGGLGVPMEVMGLMLGVFIDDYTVRVVDVCLSPFLLRRRWRVLVGVELTFPRSLRCHRVGLGYQLKL